MGLLPKGALINLKKRLAMGQQPVVAAPVPGPTPMMKKGGRVKHKKHGGSMAECHKGGGHIKHKKGGGKMGGAHHIPNHTPPAYKHGGGVTIAGYKMKGGGETPPASSHKHHRDHIPGHKGKY